MKARNTALSILLAVSLIATVAFLAFPNHNTRETPMTPDLLARLAIPEEPRSVSELLEALDNYLLAETGNSLIDEMDGEIELNSTFVLDSFITASSGQLNITSGTRSGPTPAVLLLNQVFVDGDTVISVPFTSRDVIIVFQEVVQVSENSTLTVLYDTQPTPSPPGTRSGKPSTPSTIDERCDEPDGESSNCKGSTGSTGYGGYGGYTGYDAGNIELAIIGGRHRTPVFVEANGSPGSVGGRGGRGATGGKGGPGAKCIWLVRDPGTGGDGGKGGRGGTGGAGGTGGKGGNVRVYLGPDALVPVSPSVSGGSGGNPGPGGYGGYGGAGGTGGFSTTCVNPPCYNDQCTGDGGSTGSGGYTGSVFGQDGTDGTVTTQVATREELIAYAALPYIHFNSSADIRAYVPATVENAWTLEEPWSVWLEYSQDSSISVLVNDWYTTVDGIMFLPPVEDLIYSGDYRLVIEAEHLGAVTKFASLDAFRIPIALLGVKGEDDVVCQNPALYGGETLTVRVAGATPDMKIRLSACSSGSCDSLVYESGSGLSLDVVAGELTFLLPRLTPLQGLVVPGTTTLEVFHSDLSATMALTLLPTKVSFVGDGILVGTGQSQGSNLPALMKAGLQTEYPHRSFVINNHAHEWSLSLDFDPASSVPAGVPKSTPSVENQVQAAQATVGAADLVVISGCASNPYLERNAVEMFLDYVELVIAEVIDDAEELLDEWRDGDLMDKLNLLRELGTGDIDAITSPPTAIKEGAVAAIADLLVYSHCGSGVEDILTSAVQDLNGAVMLVPVVQWANPAITPDLSAISPIVKSLSVLTDIVPTPVSLKVLIEVTDITITTLEVVVGPYFEFLSSIQAIARQYQTDAVANVAGQGHPVSLVDYPWTSENQWGGLLSQQAVFGLDHGFEQENVVRDAQRDLCEVETDGFAEFWCKQAAMFGLNDRGAGIVADAFADSVNNLFTAPPQCLGCSSTPDCSLDPRRPVCDVAEEECVECLSSADCSSGWLCDSATSSCVECLLDGDCLGGSCVAHVCVECTVDAQCDSSESCSDNMNCVDCEADNDCEEPGVPFCLGSTGFCGACQVDDDCSGTQRCRDSQGLCLECLVDSDCPGSSLCSPDGACDGCSQDSHCSGGNLCDFATLSCKTCEGLAQCGAGESCYGLSCVEDLCVDDCVNLSNPCLETQGECALLDGRLECVFGDAPCAQTQAANPAVVIGSVAAVAFVAGLVMWKRSGATAVLVASDDGSVQTPRKKKKSSKADTPAPDSA